MSHRRLSSSAESSRTSRLHFFVWPDVICLASDCKLLPVAVDNISLSLHIFVMKLNRGQLNPRMKTGMTEITFIKSRI